MKVLLLAENRLTGAGAGFDEGGSGGVSLIPFLTTLENFEASLIIFARIFLPHSVLHFFESSITLEFQLNFFFPFLIFQKLGYNQLKRA